MTREIHQRPARRSSWLRSLGRWLLTGIIFAHATGAAEQDPCAKFTGELILTVSVVGNGEQVTPEGEQRAFNQSVHGRIRLYRLYEADPIVRCDFVAHDASITVTLSERFEDAQLIRKWNKHGTVTTEYWRQPWLSMNSLEGTYSFDLAGLRTPEVHYAVRYKTQKGGWSGSLDYAWGPDGFYSMTDDQSLPASGSTLRADKTLHAAHSDTDPGIPGVWNVSWTIQPPTP